MRYDRSYRNQVFWDKDHSISLAELIEMIKQEMYERKHGGGVAYPPKTDDSETLRKGGLGTVVLVIVAALVAFLIKRDGLVALIVGFMCFFIGFTITALIIVYNRLYVRPARMTQEVSAKCIGHSLTNSDGHMLKSPVFSYYYAGRNYTAYTGNYGSGRKIPAIGTDVTIKIDPEDPMELKWSDSSTKSSFIFASLVCGIVLIGEIGMLLMVLTRMK